MKNIHVIQTDKPSNIVISTIDGKLKLNNNTNDNAEYHGKNQHIYITSDEDINENDYIITKDGRLVQVSYLLSKDLEGASKVVLTTDQDLITDGIQAVEEDFLNWFVKNPSYEYVLITNDFEQVNQDNPVLKGSTNLVLKYKITMLGEKNNKQEALEEVIGIKAHEYSMQYAGTDKYTVSMLAIQFGYQLALEEFKNKGL